jgi:uncharacterized membrane protein
MISLAVQLYDVVLFVHIAAVVIAFGVTFAYPVIFVAARRDPTGLAWFHRMQVRLGQRLIYPGLAVIIIAGIYLASKRHAWDEFWVQWSLGAALVIGALGGSFMLPRERKLAEMAEADPASSEYQALGQKVGTVGALMSLLVLVTVFVMTVKPFS